MIVLSISGSLYLISIIISLSAYADYTNNRKKGRQKQFNCYKLQALGYLVLFVQAVTSAILKIVRQDWGLLQIILLTGICLLVSLLPSIIAWKRFKRYKKRSKIYYPSYSRQRLAYAFIIGANLLLTQAK